jgi:hypothetical protein
MAIILEKSFRPRKTRKARNKFVCCVDLAIHPLGDNLKPGIPLNVFVLFVFFVDRLRFLGSFEVLSSLTTLRNSIRWGASRYAEDKLSFGHGTTTALDDAAALVLHTLHLPY